MSRRYKITYAITNLESGGAERIVCELATRLDRNVFDVCEVIALSQPSGRTGRTALELAASGIRVFELGMKSKLDTGAFFRLRRRLDETRPDILHTHLIHANILGRLAARRTTRRVSTVHICERRFRPWHFLCDRLTFGECDAEVCVSEAVRTFHAARTGIPVGKLRVIKNGIDLRPFAKLADKRAAREAFGLSMDAFVVGAAGRFDRQKGFTYLIRAVPEILRQTPGASVVIAGAGPERAALEREVRALGVAANVRFPGWVEEMPLFLRALDVFAMPSLYEGFGLTALEAKAAGVPVIASRVDSLPELIRDGENGMLIEPGSAERIAGAVTRLAADRVLLDRLRGGCRADIGDGVERMCGEYEQLYRALCGGARRP